MSRHYAATIVPAGVLLASIASMSARLAGQTPDHAGSHPAELMKVAADLAALRIPPVVDGIPDYSARAIATRDERLRALRARFASPDSAAWSVHDRVDYLLVRSELDLFEYVALVQRPTSRNPNFYLSSISSAGMMSGPTPSRLGRLVSEPTPFDASRAAAILSHMRAIPRILAQATQNLTEPDAHMARWALPALQDARARSRTFAAALVAEFPPELRSELAHTADAMGEAMADYDAWIRLRLDRMAEPALAGRQLYDWLLHRVWLLPFDADDVLRLGERENARYQTFTADEEIRNQAQPQPRPARTTAEYIRRTEEEEKAVRDFLTDKRLITIPASVGPYRRAVMPPYMLAFTLWNGLSGYEASAGGEVKYAVPETDPYATTYWEAIMRTDPSTNIFHDGIPGHYFQGVLARQAACPVRRAYNERFKSEGWATYWEEAAVQLGFYDARPRSRELIYNYLRLRAIRVIVDAKMALGQMTRAVAVRALMSVPMDERIATEEADDFFAAPTSGLVYLVGKAQIEQLLGERRRLLGQRFYLCEFHDALMQAAWVPLELTRWEMTGSEGRVTAMFADRSPYHGHVSREP